MLGQLSIAGEPTAGSSHAVELDWVEIDDSFKHCPQHNPWEQLSFLAAIDGSKQPQDYGVNADLGLRLRGQYAGPLIEELGVGFQFGSALTWTDNAVRVFELLGEDTNRFQSHTTIGVFQRVNRWRWGGVFDHLYQDGFDASNLGQFRGRVSYDVTDNTQIGLTGRLRAYDDTVEFLGNSVTLRSINQGDAYIRHFFETGVQATCWLGLAEEHGESNAAFGAVPAHDDAIVFGADFYAPLNNSLALYGETNLTTPADTGTVDAFLGMVYYPFSNAKVAHHRRWAPLLPTAAPTSFGVDLLP
ncbi:hypothetical protein LOC71_22215 [Rhodopirellula sp. JC740]|uniref:Alginate export domain-containing protein n=1 Tax=Rhodopirellula halodulae TaxID=2894198 RepID=A0ABS8NN56_9BACT|nr:hypothetical protein [Rhodopirellula sp. JC740]